MTLPSRLTPILSVGRAVSRRLDWLALLFVMAAICNFGLVTSDLPISRDGLNTLDESWQIDLVYKASQGVWSGKDFAFTYGPLWQWLALRFFSGHGVSSGAVFKLLYLFSHWAAFVCVFLTGRLLLPNVASWRRAVFVAALAGFWLPADPRVCLAVLSFALYIRLTEDVSARWAPMLIRSFVATGVLAACFLMAGDAGALSAVGLAIVLFSALVLNWRNGRRAMIIRFALCSAGSLLFWMVAVNVWAGGALRFQFWIWSFQIISAYRWIMAAPMTVEAAIRLMYTIPVCLAVFAGGWILRDPKSDRITVRPLFLLAACLFSCVALQKGIVRSGWGQIGQCIVPAVSLCGVLLVGYRDARPWTSHVSLLIAVAMTLVFSGPTALFHWTGIVSRVFWTAPPYPACPPETYYIDQACLLRREYSVLGPPSEYIQKHSAPADPIAVYPYENIFGVLSRRRVSAGVLQNYSIGGDYLMGLQISTLEHDRPPLAIYCADDIVSWPVDGISNFHRTAPVWFYLQSHYSAEAEPAAGVVVLRRNDARAAVSRQLAAPLWRGDGGESTLLELDGARWESVRPDFLRLRLRVQYSPLLNIAKPSALVATLRLADGSSKNARLAVPPNHWTDVWIFPWDEFYLKDYFLPAMAQWRPSRRALPGVRSLEIHPEPYDSFSLVPRSIRVESVDGVALTLSGQGDRE